MSSEKFQLFQQEVQQEMSKAISNSQLMAIFEKYGFTQSSYSSPDERCVQFQCILLETTNSPFKDVITEQIVNEEARAISGRKLMLADCCGWCAGGCCRC